MWLVILYETVGLYCSSDKLMMMMMKQMGRLVEEREREVGFIENTAMRHRRGG
jgi:hypothetical protein